jgi:hypothetical protein
LKRRRREFTGKELHTSLDRNAIDAAGDWRRRLGEGLHESRLLLAFLTPNSITSENCLWEWVQYLLREDLQDSERMAIDAWLASMEQQHSRFETRRADLSPALLE